MNTESRKTILFIPRWYPFPKDEMYGLFIRNHAELLVDRFKVVVIYAHPVYSQQEVDFTVDEENGIRVYRNYFRVDPKGVKRVFNPLRFLVATFRLWNRIKKDGISPDLCHVHVLTRTAILPYLLKLTQGVPYIVTEHWSRYLSENRKKAYTGLLRKCLSTFLSQNAFALTAVTNALLSEMAQCGVRNQQSLVIPNVVDTDRFQHKESKKQPGVILHVGCFDEKAKNIKGLLHTVKRLHDAGNPFKLKLVGTGEDWQMCLDYAKKIGLDPSVAEFTGLLLGQELVEEYQRCEALVLFSHYETQGVVLLEAFACGKPVIASRVGGIPEIMAPERGLLIEPGNEDQLLEALSRILDHQVAFAPPEKIRAFAEDHFSRRAILAQFTHLYHKAFNQ